jgi:hypothetical protein
MKGKQQLGRLACALSLLVVAACATRPPTIAHVHVGHALTGVHVTPNKEGYLVTAEQRGKEAFDLARRASASRDLAEIKTFIAQAVEASNSEGNFGLKHALTMASHHITFAATSDDASVNVQRAAPVFTGDIARVLERCELIGLLGKDIAASSSVHEVNVSVEEIVKLTQANLEGDDTNGDGAVGSTPAEYGLRQLRSELETVVARENPRYVTIDQWYLFNLVRLPSGKWVFDKLGRGGNIEGYK